MDTPVTADVPLLRADALQIDAGARALVRELSFELRAGEFLAVLGRNGSGKSLTLHTLAGLRRPAAGTLRCGARTVAELGRRAIARVPAEDDGMIAFLTSGAEEPVGTSGTVVRVGDFCHWSRG